MSKKNLDEKTGRRVVGIARKLKDDKGIVINKTELQAEIRMLEKGKKEIIEESKSDKTEAGQQDAKEATEKLQDIIDNLNFYMGVTYPEGLLDITLEDDKGSAVSISG